MLKKNWVAITAGTVILLLAGFFYYLYLKSPTYNWTQNYNHSSDSPYGNELLYKVMNDLYPDKEFTTIEEPLIYNRAFNNATGKDNIYFYSGLSFVPDKTTVASLFDFVTKGNQVFIAANEVSQYFIDSLLHPEYMPDEIDANVLSKVQCLQYKPALIHPDLKLKKQPSIVLKFHQVALPMDAGYFPQDYFLMHPFSNTDYYRVGYFESNKNRYTNYVKIKVGRGWLHLYTSPLVFTNYYLRKAEVFDYAQKVFLHLEPGDVYWHVNSYASEGITEDIINKGKSPFTVLLSFVSFRYAWYSFLGAIVLFILFSFKRRQRPIPVLEKNTNTSVEFAQTITKLYLADGKHKNIAQQKFRYFFNFVRTKFGINLKESTLEDKQRLANLSKFPLNKIDKIIFNYTKMESLPDTTADELNESVALINDFYKSTL